MRATGTATFRSDFRPVRIAPTQGEWGLCSSNPVLTPTPLPKIVERAASFNTVPVLVIAIIGLKTTIEGLLVIFYIKIKPRTSVFKKRLL